MRLVVIAATELEIAPCRGVVDAFFEVAGIGAANMAIATSMTIQKHNPQIIIQIGIAGAYSADLKICDRVVVLSDCQVDLGAYREGEFVHFANQAPVIDSPLALLLAKQGFTPARGASVNTACTPLRATNVVADIESMEGASLFIAARAAQISFLQLRTISNRVGAPRAEWRIEQAVAALPDLLKEAVEALQNIIETQATPE